MNQFKFYLSFENALCEEYITEKFFRPLTKQNVIPVVMGAPKKVIKIIDIRDGQDIRFSIRYLAYPAFF